ncbi:hypothetical protein A6F57_16665 [Alteromonas stellipolaris]|uniref:hypothetical protein n=1 Tax=Alteromonas stellipolaris TaxID=233316 RepID=UPI0007B4487D|nr:hypothetical protein [Alteromonas stellipolaris]ANB26677.1 hypothetical protein A6F57_16665 [Alteromonas stellipolaris]
MFARPRKQKREAIDQRILRLHTGIAKKIIAQPSLINDVQATLEARYESGMMRYGSYILWQGIVETLHTPEVFTALLLAEDVRTASLRRESIFTGILTEAERAEILED